MLREETIQAVNDWGADIVKFAKIAIGDRNRTRKSKITGKIRKGQIDYTGKLRNSFEYKVKEMPNSFHMDILAESYADDLNTGDPRQTNANKVLTWVKNKPIRFRNRDGKFIKATENDKIKFADFVTWKMETVGSDLTGNLHLGGKDVGFLDEAVREATEKNEARLTEAAFRDVEAAAEAALKNINNGSS